jgi:simple sugar transport system ATP-binding protein
VELELGPGRILGIAGVRDSGLETLELALTGFLQGREGRIEVNGRDVTGKGPGAFRAAGAAYLGAGIRGSAPALSLRDNLIIHAHRRSARGVLGLMDRAYLDRWIRRVMRRARLPWPEAAGAAKAARAPASSFSGGMLQRAVLARELAEEARLLVLAEPGWGLDPSSREALVRELRDYARGGRAVLVFSTDTEELIALADEILVLRDGRFSGGILPQDPAPRQDPALAREFKDRIGRLMVGAHA